MKNTVLFLFFLLILLSPLLLRYFTRNDVEEYKGTDNQGSELIEEIQPGYNPWFALPGKALPPAIENLLFTLQAAAGTGLLFYIIGYYNGRKKAAGGGK